MNEVVFRERLERILEHFQVTPYALSKKANLNKSMVSNYLMGSQPSFETIANILRVYPTISAEWLMRGEGPMIKDDSPKEKTYAQLNAESRDERSSIVSDDLYESLSRPIQPKDYEAVVQKAKDLAEQLSWIKDRYVSMEHRCNQMQEAYIASTTKNA